MRQSDLKEEELYTYTKEEKQPIITDHKERNTGHTKKAFFLTRKLTTSSNSSEGNMLTLKKNIWKE